jgi:hypothetical protein
MEPNPPAPQNPPSDGQSRPPRRSSNGYSRKTLKKYRVKTGRPTLLTEELRDKICNFVRIGSYIETAVAACGVSKDTFYTWLKDANHLHTLNRKALEKGEAFDPTDEEIALMDFADALEKAVAESELQDVATIRRASEDNWQAAAWRLERKFPQKWGRRYIVEDQAPKPTPIEQPNGNGQKTLDLKKLPTDHLKTLETILTAAVVEDEANETKGQP